MYIKKFLMNVFNLNASCVNFGSRKCNCKSLVEFLSCEIASYNFYFHCDELMFRNLLESFSMLAKKANTAFGYSLYNGLKFLPECCESADFFEFILASWERLEDYAYTYHFLSDLVSIAVIEDDEDYAENFVKLTKTVFDQEE